MKEAIRGEMVMHRLMRRLSGARALPFVTAALFTFVPQQLLAASAENSGEYGLVDVATGLAVSGEAIGYENEELAYSAEVAGPEYARDLGTGIASYYGDAFAGRPTASGAIFDPDELTAAHRSLPFGSKVLVTSEKTGQSVVVTINDRGPYHGNRVIDLSEAAAGRIGLIRPGSGPVSLALLGK